MTTPLELSTIFQQRKRGWKKVVKDHARKILNSSRLNSSIVGDDELFLHALIEHHPDADQKIGPGVAYFDVRSNEIWGGRTFWLVRLDGSATDFSFQKLESGPSPVQRFKAACRRAVADDMVAFKQLAFGLGRKVICSITGAELTWNNCDIDHAPPFTFDVIALKFAATRQDIAADVEPAHDGDLETYFRDQKTVELFRVFHAERARLRAVTKWANRSILKRK